MIKSLLSLIVVVLLSSCETLKHFDYSQDSEQIRFKSGVSAVELIYQNGKPDILHVGLNETYMVYGERIFVVRNGWVSHVIRPDDQKFHAQIRAIKNGESKGKNVYVLAKDTFLTEDIYFADYSKMLYETLELAGFVPVAELKKADIVVFVDFKINEITEKEIAAEKSGSYSYLWQELAYATSNYQPTFALFSAPMPKTSAKAAGLSSRIPTARQILTQSVMRFPSSYSLEAYRAVDVRSGKAKNKLWEISLQSDGLGKDRRKTFAAQTALASKFLGETTKGGFSYFVSTSDPLVQYLIGDKSAINHYFRPIEHPLKGRAIDFSIKENAERPNANGDSLAALAIRMGLTELSLLLIDAGANPNLKDKRGNSILSIAAESGNLKIVKACITAKADVNQVNKDGKPVLAFAVDSKNPDVVSALIKAGADPRKDWIDSGNGNFQKVALTSYAKKVDARMAQILQAGTIGKTSRAPASDR